MTLFQAFGQFAGQAAAVSPLAWEIVTPSSVAHTGTSATIQADGSVAVTSVSVLSLNDVFSSQYDSYMIYTTMSSVSPSGQLGGRMRAAGTDAAGADYTRQAFVVSYVSGVSGGSATGLNEFRFTETSTAPGPQGNVIWIYRPAAAEYTRFADIAYSSVEDGRGTEYVGYHEVATAYDGITFLGPTFTGIVRVFRLRTN